MNFPGVVCFAGRGGNRPTRFPPRLVWVAGWFFSLWAARARGENHLDYRYEYYAEENKRITVHTHSVYFEQRLIESIAAKGELIYDGISGATPTGAKPGASGRVPMIPMRDFRHAGNLALDGKWGPQTLTPGFAYSKESDYESYGISLNDAVEFNEKNTIVQLGGSHDFDRVLDNGSPRTNHPKDATEVMVGVSQLLSPKTIFAANLTYGNEYGYLSDPYRIATFDLFGFAFPERRPGHKSKEVFLVSLTQSIGPLHASIEGSYRFHHDSYDIFSHTGMLTWHQRIGKHVLVEPRFRFYDQTAAAFYATSFPGLSPPASGFYSADYRLSQLYSLDFGVQLTVMVTDWLHLNAGYHRYEMYGRDHQTAAGMYPKADIVKLGVQLWF